MYNHSKEMNLTKVLDIFNYYLWINGPHCPGFQPTDLYTITIRLLLSRRKILNNKWLWYNNWKFANILKIMYQQEDNQRK